MSDVAIFVLCLGLLRYARNDKFGGEEGVRIFATVAEPAKGAIS